MQRSTCKISEKVSWRRRSVLLG